MNTEELITAAEGVVKELKGRINSGRLGLGDAEARIVEMVNWIGGALRMACWGARQRGGVARPHRQAGVSRTGGALPFRRAVRRA